MSNNERIQALAYDQHKGEMGLFEAQVMTGGYELPQERPSDTLTVTSSRAVGCSYFYSVNHFGPQLQRVNFDAELDQPLTPFRYKKPTVGDNPLSVTEEWEDKERHGYYPLAVVRNAVRNPHHWHREDEAVVCAVVIGDHWETRFFPRQNLQKDTWVEATELLRRQIKLEPISLENARELFELIDRNRAHLSQHGDTTASKYPTVESMVESITNPRHPRKLRFAIRNGLGEIVGSINLNPDSVSAKKAEIGYYLGGEFQGYGYMTRAVTMLTQEAFDELGYEEVYGDVRMGNKASAKVLLRAGYTQTGEFTDDWNHDYWVFSHAKDNK